MNGQSSSKGEFGPTAPTSNSIKSSFTKSFSALNRAADSAREWYRNHRRFVHVACRVAAILVYSAYLIWALVTNAEKAAPLAGFTLVASLVWLYERYVKPIFVARRAREAYALKASEQSFPLNGAIDVEAADAAKGEEDLPPASPNRRLSAVLRMPEIAARPKRVMKIGFSTLIFVGILLAVIFVGQVYKYPESLYSGLGLIVFVLVFFVFSHDPARVYWRPVFVGFVIQFLIAFLVLKSKFGFCLFQFLGDEVKAFLEYANKGIAFVFSEEIAAGKPRPWFIFAFKILPIIIFFSSVVTILFHTGIMLYVTKKIAHVTCYFMGTTAAESLVAVANIFIGQSEAPLMIRPFIADMTKSEMHSIMTSGMATVAGTVLGAYINFGVEASHLICASIMSAPAALAMSKLFYPETSTSKTTFADVDKLDLKSPYHNVLEAASRGATDAIALAAGVAANLIAFISLAAFADAVLGYFGGLVGVSTMCDPLTLDIVLGYLFVPVAWCMGVSMRDCFKVGELLGTKLVINEFVAYHQLGDLIKTRRHNQEQIKTNPDIFSNVTLDYIRSQPSLSFTNSSAASGCAGALQTSVPVGPNVTLSSEFLDYRSELIATYALCGFANFGSIGITLGSLTMMAPSRSADLASVVFRAMITANFACFMTACVAGLLFGGGDDAGRDCSLTWF